MGEGLEKLFNFKSALVQYTLLLSLFLLTSLTESAVNDPNIRASLIINFLSFYIPSLILFSITTILLKLKGVNYFNYSITTIILYLLVHPTTPWWILSLTMVTTITAKYFIRYKQLPVFNPAALGLFLTYYVSVLLQKLGLLKETLFVSWWGAELNRTSYAKMPFLYIFPVLFMFLFLYYAFVS